MFSRFLDDGLKCSYLLTKLHTSVNERGWEKGLPGGRSLLVAVKKWLSLSAGGRQ